MITAAGKAAMDKMLEEVDDKCIASGEPPLSCLVIHDDGAPSTAIKNTIKKHGLQKPGESIEQAIERLRDEAIAFHK